MSELEDRLRTMLRERAGDVTQVPAHVVALPDLRPHANRRAAWLIAAAVAIVLAVAAAVVAVSGDRRRSEPAATLHTPPPRTATATPTRPPAHAARSVHLAWFGMRAVPGFAQHDWQSAPGMRTVGLRSSADNDVPVNCNSCEMVSDTVHVFDAGVFAAARYGVPGWPRTTVGGQPAYRGSMIVYGSRSSTKVPTLAWTYRPDAWAIVQGVTPLGGRTAVLRQIAAAVRAADDVPIGLPFRLDTVPPGTITAVEDDRAAGYAFTLRLTGPEISMDVTLWRGHSFAGRFETASATRQTIDGRPGWFDPNQGFAAAYHDGVAVVGLDVNEDDTVGDRAAAAQRQAQAQLLLRRLMAGIHWTNGDGRAPYVPAEQAIP